MTNSERKVTDREITYRVGWKKGRIHVQDSGQAGDPAVHEADRGLPALERNKLLRLIWKSAPYPTAKGTAVFAGVLPLAAFTLIVWLVSRLSQG